MASGIIVSPKGELMWAKVTRPVVANAGKPDEREEYSVDLLLAKADAEAQELVKRIKQAFVDAHGTASRPGPNGLPYKTYLDEQGNETDLWKFTFKRGVATRRGNLLPPPVVQDAQKTAWPADVHIGNGSAGKVAFKPYTWNNPEAGKGISLQLEGVRVLHLVPYVPPSAADAFGDAEEGYVLAGDEPRAAGAAGQQGGRVDGWDDGPASEEEIPF